MGGDSFDEHHGEIRKLENDNLSVWNVFLSIPLDRRKFLSNS